MLKPTFLHMEEQKFLWLLPPLNFKDLYIYM